ASPRIAKSKILASSTLASFDLEVRRERSQEQATFRTAWFDRLALVPATRASHSIAPRFDRCIANTASRGVKNRQGRVCRLQEIFLEVQIYCDNPTRRINSANFVFVRNGSKAGSTFNSTRPPSRSANAFSSALIALLWSPSRICTAARADDGM